MRGLQVLRVGERASNIHRLCEIRDAADNMPAVNAIKTLEQLDAEAISRPASQTSPGIVLRILTVAASAPTGPSSFVNVTPPEAPPFIDGD
jgi:hypothetical protein